MKRKLKRNDVIVPNVVDGGRAIPVGHNLYYLNGRKHSEGGIDIGENPKTGIEAEDGEVVKTSPNDIKIFSSVRFLGGKSPAELVLQGNNPERVFDAQENYKDRNNLNDDGTKKGKRNKAETGRKIVVTDIEGNTTVPIVHSERIAGELPIDIGNGNYQQLSTEDGKIRAYKTTGNSKFYDDWNARRLATGRYSNQINDEVIANQKANRDDTSVLINPNMPYYTENNGRITGGIATAGTPMKFTTEDGRTGINFGRRTGTKINVGSESLIPGTTILTHELGHASVANPQYNKIKEIIGNKYSDPYLDKPEEIYSRLMEIRQAYGLNPDIVYTPDEVKNIVNQSYNKDKNSNIKFNTGRYNNFMGRYDTETLTRLINDVASRNNNTDFSKHAKYGKRIKAQDGTKRNNSDLTVEEEEYINAKRNEIINSALAMSENENYEGVAPYIVTENGNPYAGLSCIYSASNLFGKNHRVSSNWDLHRNPSKYGFTIVDNKNIKKGDIIQYWDNLNEPNHSVFVSGFDDNNYPLIDYSNGSAPMSEKDFNRYLQFRKRINSKSDYSSYKDYVAKRSGNYRRNKSTGPGNYYSLDGKNYPKYVVYRFTGTPDEIEKWKQEVNEPIIIADKEFQDRMNRHFKDFYLPRVESKIPVKTIIQNKYEDKNIINEYKLGGNMNIRKKAEKGTKSKYTNVLLYGIEKILANRNKSNKSDNSSNSNNSNISNNNSNIKDYKSNNNYLYKGYGIEGDEVLGPNKPDNLGNTGYIAPSVVTAKKPSKTNETSPTYKSRFSENAKIIWPDDVVGRQNGEIEPAIVVADRNAPATPTSKSFYHTTVAPTSTTINSNTPKSSSPTRTSAPATPASKNSANNELALKAAASRQNTIDKVNSNIPVKAETNNEKLATFKGFDKFKSKVDGITEEPAVYHNPDMTNLVFNGISGLSDLGATIGSYFTNKSAIDKLSKVPYGNAPIGLAPTKLKTKINVNPQLDRIREDLSRIESDIDNNTSSSRVALARKQRARNNATAQYNQIQGAKENAETELINQDLMQQQQTKQYNNQLYNNYIDKKNAYERELAARVADMRGENAVNLFQGIGDSIAGVTDAIAANNRYASTLAATQAANPNAVKVMNSDMVKNYEKDNGKISFFRNRRKRIKDNNA